MFFCLFVNNCVIHFLMHSTCNWHKFIMCVFCKYDVNNIMDVKGIIHTAKFPSKEYWILGLQSFHRRFEAWFPGTYRYTKYLLFFLNQQTYCNHYWRILFVLTDQVYKLWNFFKIVKINWRNALLKSRIFFSWKCCTTQNSSSLHTHFSCCQTVSMSWHTKKIFVKS